MPASVIVYEVLRLKSEPEELRRGLNEMGQRGFRLQHTQVDEQGLYTFIFSKDTGITAEEPRGDGGAWIDDGFVNEETSWS